MEEIKIWSVDDVGALQVQPWGLSEKVLEDTLVYNPHLLMPGLTLVGRQIQAGAGFLDILAIDDSGKLVVFELKRDAPSRWAVAQVIDYASYLDSLDDSDLTKLIAENLGKEADDFHEWYSENYRDGELRPIRMVLVGVGADQTTERMVSYLTNEGGLDISLITFHGFKYEDRTLLARQVVVETKKRLNAEERWYLLEERAKGYGVYDLFIDVCEMFTQQWQGRWGLASRRLDLGIDFRPPTLDSSGNLRRQGAYARIDPHPDGVHIVFYRLAIELCPSAFEQPIKDIPFHTWPSNRENNALVTPYPEIQFRLTVEGWATHKWALTELARSLYEALQERNQGSSSLEADFEYNDDDEG